MENWLKSINENRFISQYSSLLIISFSFSNDTKVAVYYNVATHTHRHAQKNTHETHTLKQISLSIQNDVLYFSLQLLLPLCSALTISHRFDFIRNTGAAADAVMNLLWAILVFHLLYSIVYGFVSSRPDFFTLSNYTFRCWMFIDFSYVALQYDVVESRIAELFVGLFGGFFGPQYFWRYFFYTNICNYLMKILLILVGINAWCGQQNVLILVQYVYVSYRSVLNCKRFTYRQVFVFNIHSNTIEALCLRHGRSDAQCDATTRIVAHTIDRIPNCME